MRISSSKLFFSDQVSINQSYYKKTYDSYKHANNGSDNTGNHYYNKCNIYIQVCEGDRVLVETVNTLPSTGVSLHWHGMTLASEKSEIFMDGTPGVTQCPIMPGGTFTYSFIANLPGTHFWHAQTGKYN